MGENQNQNQNQRSWSRLGVVRNAAAAAEEIVEVRGGGHIVRSTGRKDRHSKVCTAKGPRDRRVRLSAHTAIQFYDVQDRLGYDRPSKAVDWLMKKAKPAIDELAQLPAWKPIIHHDDNNLLNTSSVVAGPSSSSCKTVGENENDGPSFLPPTTSMDSDAIADTLIKSFFPIPNSNSSANAMHFQTQDLRLSLQSFQDPTILLHHAPPASHGEAQHLFAATQLGFNASQHHQRLAVWNAGIDSAAGDGERVSSGSGTEGYLFNSPAPPPAAALYEQVVGGESQPQFLCSQRGPLQSSNTPWIRAWTEPSAAIAITAAADPTQHQTLPFYPSPLSSGLDGFSGFRIPARIQGEEEEEHDGISDKLSSASSHSCH